MKPPGLREIAIELYRLLRYDYTVEQMATLLHDTLYETDWLAELQPIDEYARIQDARLSGDDFARFMTHVQQQSNGCLVWTGLGVSKQRPLFNLYPPGGCIPVSAARWLYEHERGPLPETTKLRQTCETTNCVAIEHQRIATKKEA